MLGILAGLGIFTPFATGPDCKNDTTNKTSNVRITFENQFWNENQVFIPAVVLTAIFVGFTVLLLVFVKENKGTRIFFLSFSFFK